MASSSSRKTLLDPAAVFPQESSDRLLGDAPGELHAFLVLAAYAPVLGGLAFYLFHRRDIPGASRS